MSQLSLVEARITRVRVNNEPSTPPVASLAHANIYFLVNLWRGIANSLNVECSKLDNSERENAQSIHTKQCQPEYTNELSRVSRQLISGSRGVIGPNEVRSLRYKLI